MTTQTPHKPFENTHPAERKRFGLRRTMLAALAIVILMGAAALAADLAFKGAIYDYLWSVTGETSPAQQVIGFGQYLMRWTRDQPETAPYADMAHVDVSPFGVNTFLELEVEPAKREQQMQMIAAAGFDWIRQQFRWDDLEIHGKGDFEDRRNDLDGDGEPDVVSAWAKYDQIVALAEQYDITIMARLSDPPAWSQPAGTTNPYTPPENFDDFADYARAVAERYRGRIRYFQVWNEPNLYPEWGDQTVNAEAYTDLLCRTYRALKAVDPANVVITGALGPTIDLSGRNAYDLLYLQRMYQAGAGDCFDVLSAQGYGLWSGPTDERLRQVTVNYQRHLWLRDIMVANGDAEKPIWISEAAWNPVPNDPAIADLERYGRVTMAEAAEWAPLAYARAIEEWPWIGVIDWWYFKRPDASEQNASWYYFRLVEPDFTPTPVYDALAAFMTREAPYTLGAGRHSTAWKGTITQADDGRETHTFRVEGTAVYLCGAGEGALTVVIDSAPPKTRPVTSGCTPVASGMRAGEHTIAITADTWNEQADLVVIDHGPRHRLPWILVGMVVGVFGLVLAVRTGDLWLRRWWG